MHIPSTAYHIPSTIYRLYHILYTIYPTLYTIYCILYTIYCVQNLPSTIYYIPYTTYHLLYTIHSLGLVRTTLDLQEEVPNNPLTRPLSRGGHILYYWMPYVICHIYSIYYVPCTNNYIPPSTIYYIPYMKRPLEALISPDSP